MAIIEIDWSKLEGMLLYDPTIEVCAHELGTSRDTLIRRIREKHNKTFLEYKKVFTDKTALKLKNTMIKKAFEGNVTCMIFCLKNLSDWKDKVETETKNTQPIQIVVQDKAEKPDDIDLQGFQLDDTEKVKLQPRNDA